MKLAITGLIFAVVVWSAALAGDTKQFPASPGWLSWLRIDYPERFELDPKSFQGEAKWWVKFKEPESEFSFEVGAFGYVSDLDLAVTIPGVTYENYSDTLPEDVNIEDLIAEKAKHKNVGDYFRAKIMPKGCEEAKFPGYERFIQREKDRVEVFYLDSAAYRKTFGRCYQTLTFTFPEGAYEKHKKDIDAIIQSAKPPYQINSEQDGGGQPATRPESK
jgi:hypothetical protein